MLGKNIRGRTLEGERAKTKKAVIIVAGLLPWPKPRCIRARAVMMTVSSAYLSNLVVVEWRGVDSPSSTQLAPPNSPGL